MTHERTPRMTREYPDIQRYAAADDVAALRSVLRDAQKNLDTSRAQDLETAGLKFYAHTFFVRIKGEVSGLAAQRPDLAAVTDAPQVLREHNQAIQTYLDVYSDEWHQLVGATQTPREARRDILRRMQDTLSDSQEDDAARTSLRGYLGAAGAIVWDNQALREVIAENWAQGVTEAVWGVAVQGQEAAAELAEGARPADEIAMEYALDGQQLYDEALAVIHDAITETNPVVRREGQP